MTYALVSYDFYAAADIWKAYFSGRISAKKRDELLAPMRNALRAARK